MGARRPAPGWQRELARDGALPALLLVLSLLFIGSESVPSSYGQGFAFDPARLSPAAIVLATVVHLPLLWRRRAPVPVLAVIVVLTIPGGLALGQQATGLFATGAGLYAVAVARPLRWSLPALPLAVVPAHLAGRLLGGGTAVGPGDALLEVVVAAVLFVPPWGAGLAVRAARTRRWRRELAQAGARARRREEAVDAERSQIARELHDILSHGLTLLALQANGAAAVLDRDPDRALAALATIEQVARQSLAETGRLVGLHPGAGAARDDGGGLAQLDALAERMAASGLEVAVVTRGLPATLPSAVDRAAYRIVQEALTNVARHARGASRVEVTLERRDLHLHVDVHDDGGPTAAPPAGHDGKGLRGMAERARLVGGQVRSGPAPGGGFRVEAALPLDPTPGPRPPDGPPRHPASRWLVDAAIAVALLGVDLGNLWFQQWAGRVVPDLATVTTLTPAMVAIVALAKVPLLWRQRHPLPALVATTIAVVGLAFAGLPGSGGLAAGACLFEVARARGRHVSLPALAAVLLASLVAVVPFAEQVLAVAREDWLQAGNALASWVFSSVTPWWLGDRSRRRRLRHKVLDDRSARAARERIAEERAGLGRRLQELLGESVALVLALAEEARRRRADRAAVAELVAAIAGTASASLTEVRRLLALLRGEADAGAAPSSSLGAVLADARARGVAITETGDGGQPLDPSVERAAVRIVEEALALPHLAVRRLAVDTGPRGLSIQVVLGGPAGPPGRSDPSVGVLRMRERARAVGGSLDVRRAHGRLSLHADLPQGRAPVAVAPPVAGAQAQHRG